MKNMGEQNKCVQFFFESNHNLCLDKDAIVITCHRKSIYR